MQEKREQQYQIYVFFSVVFIFPQLPAYTSVYFITIDLESFNSFQINTKIAIVLFSMDASIFFSWLLTSLPQHF